MTEAEAGNLIRTAIGAIRAAHEYAGPTIEGLRYDSPKESVVAAIEHWAAFLPTMDHGDLQEERLRVRGLARRANCASDKLIALIDTAIQKERERRNV